MSSRFDWRILRAAKGVPLIACVGLVAIAGCSLPETQAADSSTQPQLEPQTVGWVEKATISGIDAAVDVKLDTGATTSSINAEILEQPDGDEESGGMIKFRYEDEDGNEAVFERPVVRWVSIKAREGEPIRRPVVQMKFCVAGRWIEEEVNLSDRDDFNYPVLIGRNMLEQGKLVVDSSQTFVTEPSCSEEEAQS
jgi:hypothetical protein